MWLSAPPLPLSSLAQLCPENLLDLWPGKETSQTFLLAGRQAQTPSLTLPGLSHPSACAFQIPAAQVSLVLFGGKVSGAAADPVAGFFINRSRRTGSGRLMPW